MSTKLDVGQTSGFNASVVQELLQSVALQNDAAAENKLDVLIAALPSRLTKSKKSANDDRPFRLGESQQAILGGLPYFLSISNGRFASKIVPILIATVDTFPNLQLETSYGNIHAEQFSFMMTVRFLECARFIPTALPDDFVIQTVVALGAAVLPKGTDEDETWASSTRLPASTGFLKALRCSRFNWNEESLSKLCSLMKPFQFPEKLKHIDQSLSKVAAGDYGDEPKRALSSFRNENIQLNSAWFRTAYLQIINRILASHALQLVSEDTKSTDLANELKKSADLRHYRAIVARELRLWRHMISTFGTTKQMTSRSIDTEMSKVFSSFLKEAVQAAKVVAISENLYLDDYALQKGTPTDAAAFALLTAATQTIALAAWHDHSELNSASSILTEQLLSPSRQPFPEELPTVLHAIDGITLLACRYPDAVSAPINSLRQFIITPGPMFVTVADDLMAVRTLQESFNRNFVTILQLRSSEGNQRDGFERSLVVSLSDTLYAEAKKTTDKDAGESEVMTANVLSCLVTIANTYSNNAEIGQAVSLILRRFFSKPLSSLDELLVEYIAHLAVKAHPTVFEDILAILSFAVKGTWIPEQGFSDKVDKKIFQINRARAFDALAIIAKDFKPGDSRTAAVCLDSFLSLFIWMASIYQAKQPPSSPGPQPLKVDLADLEVMLFIISELLHSHGSPELLVKSRSPPLLQLFRQTWFYLVLHKLVPFNVSTVPVSYENEAGVGVAFNALSKVSVLSVKAHQSITRSLQRIAAHTPALVSSSSKEQVFDVELEMDELWKRHQDKAEKTAYIREVTSKIFLDIKTGKTVDLANRSVSQRLFLVMVYQVEISRPLNTPRLLSHLIDYAASQVFRGGQFVGILEPLLHEVMNCYINNQLASMSSQSRHKLLEAETEYLLVEICNRFSHIRNAAHTLLQQLLHAFQQLLWSRPLIETLLNLLSAAADAYELGYGDTFTPVQLPSVLGPPNKLVVTFSSDFDNRAELFDKINNLAKSWLERAQTSAPPEMHTQIQDYVVRLSLLEGHHQSTHVGASLALQMASTFDANQPNANASVHIISSRQAAIVIGTANRAWLEGERNGLDVIEKASQKDYLRSLSNQLVHQLHAAVLAQAPSADVAVLLRRATSILISLEQVDFGLLAAVCWTPVRFFRPELLRTAIWLWRTIAVSQPRLDALVMSEVVSAWDWTIGQKLGLFSHAARHENVLYKRMNYSPPPSLTPPPSDAFPEASHSLLLDYFLEQFTVTSDRNQDHVALMGRLLQSTMAGHVTLSLAVTSRLCRFQLVLLGLRVIQAAQRNNALLSHRLRERIYKCALNWFTGEPCWMVGDLRRMTLEVSVLIQVQLALQEDKHLSPQQFIDSFVLIPGEAKRVADLSLLSLTNFALPRAYDLLNVLLQAEIDRLLVWRNPTNSLRLDFPLRSSFKNDTSDPHWPSLVQFAWSFAPELALRLPERFKASSISAELRILIKQDPSAASHIPSALNLLITDDNDNFKGNVPELQHILHWSAVPPMTALSLFLKKYESHPLVLAYAVRVLRDFPAENILFYTPQVVQTLRHDKEGFVERYILESAKTRSAQLLAHQLLWNMHANTYLDIDSTKPDPLKPVLERISAALIESFEGEARDYYTKEFEFFDKVTGISGALKPFIKKPKSEKKAKIDEEIARIAVVPGVYLPSNPTSTVVDIDYKSGRPLQSHAKAPFMATFKVLREIAPAPSLVNSSRPAKNKQKETQPKTETVWQSCIFKVGDDCRQDVLALQLIALFQNIFTDVGLDLYTFPYKVVATSPGCGIIEVVPNTISRDILGREFTNDLYAYYIHKFGPEDSEGFQKARANFVRSMAAYSVVVYLLTLRDRHNGNVMMDDVGHIIHIDFGFILGISPGGVVFNDIIKSGFETSPFLLKKEMVQIMGGSLESPPFQWFTELVIQGYLAARPYVEEVVQMVTLMMDSGLPCFRGEETIRRLRDKFQPHLTERQAAEFMRARVQESYNNFRTNLYDQFQKMQNGIPY